MYYKESQPVRYIKANWRKFKGKSFSHNCKTFKEGEGLVPAVEIITITGIGKQAIQYIVDNNKDKPYYARYDNGDANGLASIILTCKEATPNPFWNKETLRKRALQRTYTRRNHHPMFTPEKGFCWSCGEQIYNALDEHRVSNDLITGCPYCSRSYID